MKTIISLILILMLNTSINIAQNSKPELYFQTYNSDFVGVATDSTSILCYGSNGLFLYSSDMGETWNQKNIERKHNVRYVEHYNGNYYGFSNFGFLKTEDGKFERWSVVDFSNQETPVALAVQNDKIFVLYSKSLDIYDLDFNLIRDEAYNHNLEGNCLNIIKNDNSIYIIFDEGILHYSTSSEEMISERIIKFDECEDCKFQGAFREFEDNLYLDIYDLRTKLYTVHFDRDFNFIKYFRYQDLLTTLNPRNGIIFQKDVSVVLNNTRVSSRMFDSLGVRLSESVAKIELVTYDNQFNILPIYDDTPIFDQYFNLSNIGSINLVRINSNIIVGVGANKQVVLSKDNGKSWDIISYFSIENNIPLVNFVDQNNLVAVDEKRNLCYSNDGGIIFKPIKINPLRITYNQTSFSLLANSAGNGLIHQPINFSQTISLKFDVNNETIEFDTSYINFEARQVSPNEGLKLNNKTLIYSLNMLNPSETNIQTKLLKYDEKMNIDDVIILDSLIFIDISKSDDNSLYALFQNKKMPYLDGNTLRFANETYGVLTSNNEGESWNLLLDSLPWINNVDICVKGKYLYANGSAGNERGIYIINIENGDVDYLPIANEFRILFRTRIFTLENTLYVASGDKLYYNIDPENSPFEWDSLNIFDYVPSLPENAFISYCWSDNSMAFVFFAEEVLGFGSHKFEMFSLTSSPLSNIEEAETETPRSRAFLRAYNPYPLPASSQVNVDILFNAQYSASEAVLKVFDSMGNEIPNANVELQQTNPYSGTVTWDCGAYPTGVYFIQVTIGTEQKNVGVAVVR